MPADDPWLPVVPAKLVSPSWSFTLGPEVADFCALLGFEPMPEQEQFLDAVFAVGSDGLPAVSDATEIAGRQNLKTGEFAMVALGWMFLTEEDRALWSAHEFGTTRGGFLLMRSLIERKQWAERRVLQFYASSNYTAIVMHPKKGRTEPRACEFTARTTSQGRGKSAPKAIWDEGLELRAEHLGAQDAVKSTFPWAQTLIGSSAAKSYSEVLHGIIDQAYADQLGPKDFFREFKDDLGGECLLGVECTHVYGTAGCRLDDKRRWKRGNPALDRIHADGRGLTTMAIARERRKQPNPLIFARERLGWHDRLITGSDAVFSEEGWTGLRDPKSRIAGEATFALHVSPNRDWSALVAGGRTSSGRVHLEVPSKAGAAGARLYARWPGTDRVVPYLRKILKKRIGETLTLLVLDKSAAASLVPALERLDEDPKLGDLNIVIVPETSMPAACGHLVDAVARGDIVHVGDPELQASMLAVAKRMVAEKAFVWSPRSSAGDITAAVAATMLAWHFESGEPEYDVMSSGY